MNTVLLPSTISPKPLDNNFTPRTIVKKLIVPKGEISLGQIGIQLNHATILNYRANEKNWHIVYFEKVK